MSQKYVLAIDQGTTGTRAVVVDHRGEVVAAAHRELPQHYPQPGWVEHDARRIWRDSLEVVGTALASAGLRGEDISAIGITNQRETTVLWDRHTGEPVHNAIVWQCRRTASLCDELEARGLEDEVRRKTGLLVDAYFSATKLRWLLDNVPGVREKAERGDVLFGTVDSWLVWNLTGGRTHTTDYTNASRTMLFNIHKLEWDGELLEELDIPRQVLPAVRPSSDIHGYTAGNGALASGIPIAGIAGDQQASLFGQGCFAPGTVKNTYGTGCFLVLNLGERAVLSPGGLLTTLACGGDGRPVYALEGAVFSAGSVVQWLRDGLGILAQAGDSEPLAREVEDTGGVYLVPAFTGLGAPYWDMRARAAILGLTRGTKREHIVRAALESIAFQTRDVLDVMARDSGMAMETLRVDGGAAANGFLMQFQADVLGMAIERAALTETTALGAAYLAGLATGYWRDERELSSLWRLGARFEPALDEELRERLYAGWKSAVARVLTG
ncbi:MAG: glycerol kinase GlpK [Chloroflexota bacterium]|nr:glycerol kinase GlpK [Chloroflexota bacterium]